MKKLFILFVVITSSAFAQKNSISLDSCMKLAKVNYPLIKQNGLIDQLENNNINGINKNWLPKLSFQAKATYQSEVTSFNIPGFGNLFPVFPKDNYQGAIDLEQTLFDAGQIKQQKRVEKLNSTNELQKNEIELYKLIDRVTQLYSNILLVRANLKTLIIYKDDINNKKNIISESLKNGLVLQSSLDELDAEELKTEQSIVEAMDNADALYQSMKLLINIQWDDSTNMLIQAIGGGTAQGTELNRPELKLFDAQKSLLDARHVLTNKAALPKLTVSGEGAYGRPGYDILNQNFRFFGIAGINLKWNIGTLYSLSVEKQNLNINKQMIDVQKEVFEFNLKTTLTAQAAQVNTLTAVIEKDKTIIEKRHNIRVAASSQLENGNITSTDYLIQLNAEMQAILNQKIHEIKLMNAISNYNTTKGISNF